MQIIMSPAKLMDFSSEKMTKVTPTQPLFREKTEELLDVCRRLSVEDIISEMKINPEMAREVYASFQTYDAPITPKKAAAFAYNGIAYKGLDALSLTQKDMEFAQQHLNILSGLYGIVRPLDSIRPYRLEMGRKIAPQGYKNLYDFWEKSLNSHLASKLTKKGSTIINVASKEYSKVIKKSLLPSQTRIIEINFLQQENDRLKQIVVHSKKARGLMARFIIQNKITQPEDVKAFHLENYFFYPQLSTRDKWFFVR